MDLMFSTLLDTTTLKTEDGKTVPVLNTGIARPSHKQIKFRNPPNRQTDLSAENNHFKPGCIFNIFFTHPNNNGLQNEDFIVWMATDSFLRFLKLYRRPGSVSYIVKICYFILVIQMFTIIL
jgi:hypothetical protein